MGSNHAHLDPGDHQQNAKRLLLCITLNMAITLLQAIGGILSGSLSLLSDALHNFSDVVSLVVSYIACRLMGKKVTRKKTFGYKRAEIIAAFTNSVTLMVVAVIILREAAGRFGENPLVHGTTVVVLAGLGIVVNGFCALILRKNSHDNLNIKSAYLHLFSDFVTSVAVLLGGLLMVYYQMYWVDTLLAVFIALYLVYHSWKILLSSLKILMQFTPKKIDLDQLENEIAGIENITNIHHVHIWQLNDRDIHLEAHLDFDSDISLSQIKSKLSEVKKILREKFKISHSTLQPEYGVDDSKALIAEE